MKKVTAALAIVTALALMMAAVGMAADPTTAKTAPQTASMDPVKVAPDLVREVLDNPSVRVLEFDLKPGDKTPMFTIGDRTVYFVTDNKSRVTESDGKVQDVERHAGEVAWMAADTRSVENIGTTEIRAIVTELKGKAHMSMVGHTGTHKHSKTASNTSNKGM
jgi:hypothetical protein